MFIADIAAGTASGPYFYTIADLDSANAILTVPLAAMVTAGGLQVTISAPFTFTLEAFDNYFTGNLTDVIADMRYELDMPQFCAGSAEVTIPANRSASVTVYPTTPYNGDSPSQTGLLLLYTNGLAGQEAATVRAR